MIIYILMLVYALFATQLIPSKVELNGRPIKYLKSIIVMTSFFLVAACRYNVGIDYTVYTVDYYNLGNGSNGREYEILGTLIIQIARLFKCPQIIIILYAFLYSFFTFAFIKDNSPSFFLSTLIVFITGNYFTSLNTMRQCSATAIVLFAIKYLFLEKKYMRFLIFFIISTMIHKTSFIFILPYVLYLLIRKLMFHHEHIIKCIMIFSLAVAPLMLMVLRDIATYISFVLQFYNNHFNSKYDSFHWSKTMFMLCIPNFLMSTLSSIKDKKNNNNLIDRNIFLYVLSYFGALFSLILPIIPNGERICFLYNTAQIVSVPYFWKNMTIYKIKKKQALYIKIILLLLYILNVSYATYIFFVVKDSIEIFPYYFY